MDRKVTTIEFPKKIEMILPRKRFEPFFLKVMRDFLDHHKLPHLDFPKDGALPHIVFSYIVESLAYSMGAEKRKELIEELEQYKLGLPFDIR